MRLFNYILRVFGLLALISFFSILSCKKESKEDVASQEPYVPTPVALRVPFNFPPPVIPDFNPLTAEGIRLGRMLFYDPIVSSNGRSCSSCHHQDRAFSTPIHIHPNGDHASVPPLVNVAWNPDYEWIGQAPVLDHVPLGDFEPEFFNTNMDTLVNRIKNHALYPRYFYEAFGVSDVGSISHNELKEKISYALIQFVRTIISDNSKFDRVRKHEDVFSLEEGNGYLLFYTERGDCFHCHGTPLLTNNIFSNTGLDLTLTGQNLGRYLYTGNPSDMGKFSAPTLRNIALTAPYMHDGRFQTLQEVIDFYDSGVHWNSPNIDPIMTKPFKESGLHLTAQEKSDLLSFLMTFTDSSLLVNSDYSSPF